MSECSIYDFLALLCMPFHGITLKKEESISILFLLLSNTKYSFISRDVLGFHIPI